MNKSPTVLIVGAGPVGLTAALVLAQADIPVRVVDAGPDVDKRMRASTFHPPTLDMLETLGLASDLVSQGLPVSRFQLRQHESGDHVVFDLSDISDATSHPYRLQVEQHRYCALAVESLSRSGIDVEFNTRVESVIQSADEVTAILQNGEIHALWLIGADGATSEVRRSLRLEYSGDTDTHSAVFVSTTFPFHDCIENLSDISYCWSERGPFSLLRLKQLWRVSLHPGVEDLNAAADENRVRDWLAYIHANAVDAEILTVNPYRIHECCIDRFRVGRVLLAGDAAHLNPPSGGMGMNGGIHDAMNLSEKLIEVLAGADQSLLDRYDRQRRTLVTERIIPQASANRKRMATRDKTIQLKRLAERRATASSAVANRAYLLHSSMIAGLREAAKIE